MNRDFRKKSDVAKSCNFAKTFRGNDRQEVRVLKEEVSQLRKTVNDTNVQVAEIKAQQVKESSLLQMALNDLKKEVEDLRFEKDERAAGKYNGIEEYSQLALELVRLRTEVDRLTYLYDREKRNNHMRDLEKKHVESYWSSN